MPQTLAGRISVAGISSFVPAAVALEKSPFPTPMPFESSSVSSDVALHRFLSTYRPAYLSPLTARNPTTIMICLLTLITFSTLAPSSTLMPSRSPMLGRLRQVRQGVTGPADFFHGPKISSASSN